MPQVQICCWHAGHVCPNVAAVGTWCTNGGLVHLRSQKPLWWPTVGRLCCWFFESGFMIPNRSTVKTVAIYCLVIKHGNAPSNASVECHCHLCFCTSQLFTVADSLTIFGWLPQSCERCSSLLLPLAGAHFCFFSTSAFPMGFGVNLSNQQVGEWHHF